MSKTIKCKNCGKEVPESGVLFDEKSVMQAVSAPLDCDGNPIFDYSKLKQSRIKDENYCYWCGAKIEKENSVPNPAVTSGPTPPPLPRKPKNPSLIKWVLISAGLLAAVILLFFCLRSCDSDSDYEENSGLTSESDMEYVDGGEYEPGAEEGDILIVTDYSKKWADIESRFKSLGTPLEYVNANSSKDPATIKDDSYNTYKSIKDDAYELYKKEKEEHYQRYKKLKDAKYQEYQKIKDEAYMRYQNEEIDYSKYTDIQSASYDKYNTIQSRAYQTYNDIQSKAYDRYNTLQSEAYDWYSKVRSIANGL